jgi:hypothetical protein
MNRAQAIEKARKLMALGESDNEHESALAMGRAQALLERFEIELADLGSDTEAEPMVEGSWRCGGKSTMVHWKLQIASALARANGCELFYAGPKVTVCGRRADVRRTSKLWGWTTAEIERLSRSRCRGKGSSYANSFKLGAVRTLRDEIKKERDALRAELQGKVTETALVIVDTRRKESDDYMRQKNPHLQSRRSGGRIGSGDGYSAGRSAGAGVYGGAGRGAIGSGSSKQIGAGS